ncbi:NAD(P)H-binding protein [Micromonospora sp. NPDC049679]|uniref:NAD(P)H-binding protein n=1 Tax=Micromonospora sp. NPDC049679 TaxID=3155920 RepID=UPI0033D5DDAC
MRVVIAGGHGKIALRLERMLAARGDVAVGLIRNPQHVPDLRDVGAVPAICDLESASVDDVAAQLRGADAVVFAAGAGPGSGIPRKDTVDRAAAALLADAAQRAGVHRYLLVSSMGVDSPPSVTHDEVFAAYLRAKKSAEEDLRARPLNWTILRPGLLTDAPATGRVRLEPHVERGDVSRDDVAQVLMALLDVATGGETLELVGGETPIPDAIARIRRRG